MALSGTFSGSYKGYTLQTTWTATQSISGNYSDVTAIHKIICGSAYSLYIDGTTNTCTADGSSKTFTTGPISTGGESTITLGTTYHRVYHDTDGTKTFTMTTVFNVQSDLDGAFVSDITATGTITLDSISRQAQITMANNFNDEQDPYFTFTNAGGFPMSAYLRFKNEQIDRLDLGNVTGGYYTFVLTEEEREKLRNATPNGSSMNVVYGIATVISGTTYTHEVTKTMTIVNAEPSVPTLTYADTNSTTLAITGNNQLIIRNKSMLTATIGTATAKKGATIVSYTTTLNGVIKTGSGAQEFGAVNLATDGELVTTVTDSRGYKSTVKKTVSVDDWLMPIASVELYRVNNYETSSRLKVDVAYSSLSGKNTITCQYCYKKTTETAYTSWATVDNDTLVTLSLDNTSNFNVKIRIQDKLSGWIESATVLPKGTPIFFIDTKKNSASVNGFPKNNGTFEVFGRLLVNDASVVESGSGSNGNWLKLYDGTMVVWNHIEVTDQAIDSEYGAMYRGERVITYPSAFISAPTLCCTEFRHGDSASWGSVGTHATPLTKGTLCGYDVNSRQVGANCRIGWFAVGKWK